MLASVEGRGVAIYIFISKQTKLRERTMLTERPPLVGEVSVNFCG
jgi:hypothetical protein